MPTSENNWVPARVSDQNLLEWKDIPGTDGVSLQFLKGPVATVMTAAAADYNAFIERLRDADSCAYTPTNSVDTSNHLNGTAMDLNWNGHPFQVRGTFTAAQMGVIRELLAFYEDMIFWAGDWDDPIDEMHWQMGYSTYNNPKLGDFIHRKIRADGFSTFRRGGLIVTPTVSTYPSQEQMIREIWDKLRAYPLVPGLAGKWPSKAMFRDSDAGVDDSMGLMRNTDGSVWDILAILGAIVGDAKMTARVKRLADGQGPAANNPDAVNLAKAVLKFIESTINA